MTVDVSNDVKKIIATAHPEWGVLETGDGQEAIDLARGKELDVILLDFNMPVMDGGDAAKILRPQFPDAKIAFLTANIQESIKNLAIALKIDFIPKPIIEGKILKYVG